MASPTRGNSPKSHTAPTLGACVNLHFIPHPGPESSYSMSNRADGESSAI
jgi:hypothetical protein